MPIQLIEISRTSAEQMRCHLMQATLVATDMHTGPTKVWGMNVVVIWA